MKQLLALLVGLCAVITVQAQTTLNLSPKSVGGDGTFSTQIFSGQPVWVPANYLYFDVPISFTFTSGMPVYVRIEYHDAGRGKLAVQYDSTPGSAYQNAEITVRSSRVGGDEFVYSYQCFQSPLLANRQNGATDFRLRLNGSDGTALRIASVQISATPYSESQFTYALSKPWLAPYSGSTKDFVNNQTLVGKVLAGYQGWFATPNDPADSGWNHWGRSANVDPSPTEITVDQWPWLEEYETNRVYPAGNMVHQDGRPAYLFSSRDPETVQRHFRWMRKHNIDGVYLQRFVTTGNSGYYGASEFVLANVRAAANQEGRVWAIEYDISSLSTNNALAVITNDWNYLVNQCGILNDPRYLRENGKPVLFIWGFSVPDRNFTVSQADQIINWFTNQNLYLIGGVHSSWQANSSWFAHYQKYDQLLAWMESSLTDLNSQKSQLNGWGMKILPHAWPGFSWNNLQKTVFPSSYTSRNGGAFYWTRLYNAISCGADQLFLGMFDEYDEGTAIMPMSDNHPDIYNAGGTNTWGNYLDNEGRDPFWYLRLSGAAKEMLNGQRTVSSSLPASNALSAVSFAGDDATCYLGTTNNNQGLTHVQPTADGVTGGTVLGNQNCRTNGNIYFYFQVNDAFSVSNSAGLSATIEIEYYDNVAGANIRVQYDSVTNAFTATTQFSTAGSGGWKNYRWNVNNAFFGNRQNGGSDLRVAILNAVSAGKVVGIRRVSVFMPEEKSGTVISNAPAMQLANGLLNWSGKADATGWRLSQSSNLVGGNWQNLTTPTNWLSPGLFSITNNTFRYQISLTNSANFYRLGRPARQ